MSPIKDHTLRYQLANELHARPFPKLQAPCRAAFLAIKQPSDAAARDRDLDRAHLIALLDRFGVAHPQPGATHYFGEVGRHMLKWESHTEFVTYTIFGDGVAETPFDASTFSMFPEDWLKDAPGERITSALIRVEICEDDKDVHDKLEKWFVPESLAISAVLDNTAIMAGDFRIDNAGHMRFALFEADKGWGEAGHAYANWFYKRLVKIEERLATRDYLFGDRFTVADICIGYALILAGKVGLDQGVPDSLKAYRDRLTSRAAFKAAVASEETAMAALKA